MCSSGSFIVLALTFRCMIHFELTFGMVWGRGSYALFCMWISSCPSTVCRKDYSFLMKMPPYFVENQLTLYCWTFHFTPWPVRLSLWQHYNALIFTSFLFILKTSFIFLVNLFLVVLVLCCCARPFSSCGEWGPLFVWVCTRVIVLRMSLLLTRCPGQYCGMWT